MVLAANTIHYYLPARQIQILHSFEDVDLLNSPSNQFFYMQKFQNLISFELLATLLQAL